MTPPVAALVARLRALLAAATPGPWFWATSNSRKRINSKHECWTRDGAVLDAFRASDGVPCVSVRDEDMVLIVELRNNAAALLNAAEATPPAAAEVGALSAERLAEIRTDTNRWDADWQGPYRATRELLAEVDRLTAALAAAERDLATERAKMARVAHWTHEHGKALVPTAGSADTFGDGMRAAKQQVGRIVAEATPSGEVG